MSLVAKSIRAALERGRGVNGPHECPRKTEVRDEQLERLQHGAKGTRIPPHLAGQGHVLAQQCQRQIRPPPAVERASDPVLNDDQGLV